MWRKVFISTIAITPVLESPRPALSPAMGMSSAAYLAQGGMPCPLDRTRPSSRRPTNNPFVDLACARGGGTGAKAIDEQSEKRSSIPRHMSCLCTSFSAPYIKGGYQAN